MTIHALKSTPSAAPQEARAHYITAAAHAHGAARDRREQRAATLRAVMAEHGVSLAALARVDGACESTLAPYLDGTRDPARLVDALPRDARRAYYARMIDDCDAESPASIRPDRGALVVASRAGSLAFVCADATADGVVTPSEVLAIRREAARAELLAARGAERLARIEYEFCDSVQARSAWVSAWHRHQRAVRSVREVGLAVASSRAVAA